MMTLEAHFAFQKPLNTGSPKPSRMPRGTQSLLTEAEKRKGELMKKISLQSNASVEKVVQA